MPLLETADLDELKQFLETSDLPILLYFVDSSFCGPFKRIEQMMKDVSTDVLNPIVVIKIDASYKTKIAKTFKVVGAPTFIFLRKDKKLY
jgi:thioredoxin-like negative regulator of GroEL